jgi:hypothetical protein
MTVADIQANAIPVTFESEGSRLSGNVYVPPDHTPGTRVPGILVTGANRLHVVVWRRAADTIGWRTDRLVARARARL